MDRYGDEMKALWDLEPDMLFLNHGSYGATPKVVRAVQREWQDRLEAQPCQFVNAVAPRAIRDAAKTLATYLGAHSQDLAFVENTTAGINAVLKSMVFEAGDEVVVSSHVYNAVRQTLRHALEPVGARMVVADLGLPVPDSEWIHDQIMAAVTSATKLIVIDHVASITAVIFPVAEIAASARAKGIPILVDGAHGPGMVTRDLGQLGVDWYVGNCHKWLCAPKGSAFVWAAPDRQATLHPTVISHDFDKGFTAEFDKIGTRDASAWLSVPASIAFLDDLGGEALTTRNRQIAVEAATRLADRWGTETGAPETLFGSMSTVRLPKGPSVDRAVSEAMKAWLWETHRAEIHIMPFGDHFWTRFSVQAYNTLDECDAVGPLIEAAMAQVT